MRFASVLLLCGLLTIVLSAAPARADDLYMPNVGVRASSMSGAFVGLADDYSAVHWNPAGITNLTGVEMTVSVNDAIPMTSYEGYVDGWDWEAGRLDIEATSDVKHYFAPGFFAYFDGGPLRGIFDKIGLCGYTLCDVGTLWSGEEFYDDLIEEYTVDGPEAFRYAIGEGPDHESRIRAYAVSPVIAKEIVPGLSVGLAGHAVYSHLEMRDGGWVHELVEGDVEDTSYLYPYTTEEDVTGWGYGATFGLLYRATDNVSVGASLRTPISITYEGTLRGGIDEGAGLTMEQYTEEFDWTFPMWAAAGFAYRNFLFDNMTLTGDVHWTQWSKIDSIVRVGDLPEEADDLLLSRLKWEDTIQLRFGLDYRYSRSLSFRLGYRNAPSPQPDDHYDFLLPSAAHDVASLGMAYRSDRWTAEFAVEYMVSKTRDVSDAHHEYYRGTNVQDIVVPSFAFTYKF